MPLDPATQLMIAGGAGAVAGGLARGLSGRRRSPLPSVPSRAEALDTPLTPAGHLLASAHDLVMTVTEGINAWDGSSRYSK